MQTTPLTPYDLKVGNNFYHVTGQNQREIITIGWQEIKYMQESSECGNVYLKPIPLSEEILREMGAIENQKHWLINDIELSWITTDEYFEMEWQMPYHDWRITPFKYVHELQNFLYSICGQMLTLKTTNL